MGCVCYSATLLFDGHKYNFNKKSLYLLIREITGVQTSKVTKIVNELKKHYKVAHEQYARYGSIDHKDSKNKFF